MIKFSIFDNIKVMFKLFSITIIIGVIIIALAIFNSDTLKTTEEVVVESNKSIEARKVVVEKTEKVFDGKANVNVGDTNNVNTNDTKVLEAKFKKIGDTWNISVTLEHPDTGWEHYADSWQIVDESGNVIAKRVLVHPHVDEQPFTRSMNNIEIPKSQKIIFVEAGDSVHGISVNRLVVDFSKYTDDKFIVAEKTRR